MTDLQRLRVDISGSAVVGASVLTLYSSATASGLPAATLTWLNALKANFPNSMTFTVPSSGDLVNEVNGVLSGAWTESGGGVVTGTNAGSFQVGSGFRIRWGTGGLVGGRRVKGTTFFVPAAGLCFDSTGRLGSATVSAIQTATNTFLASVSPNLCIWSRPTASRAGTHSTVTSATVPPSATQLRSRRV